MTEADFINWRRIDPRISSSGQPTEAQMAYLRDLGVTTVINLGPHSNKGALQDEPGTLKALGLTYIYIPVDFKGPTQVDFEAFCKAMEKTEREKIHVHCIYNARVTAFFYLYLQQARGISEIEARALMDSVWKPGNVWAEFIGDTSAIGRDHLYAEDGY